jgi:hypothetical protein
MFIVAHENSKTTEPNAQVWAILLALHLYYRALWRCYPTTYTTLVKLIYNSLHNKTQSFRVQHFCRGEGNSV